MAKNVLAMSNADQEVVEGWKSAILRSWDKSKNWKRTEIIKERENEVNFQFLKLKYYPSDHAASLADVVIKHPTTPLQSPASPN